MEKLSHLDLDITKDDLRQLIGEPDVVRGAVKNDDGDTVTVWQYKLYEKDDSGQNFLMGFLLLTLPWWLPENVFTFPQNYWFYFVGDVLVKWELAEDEWQPYKIRQTTIDTLETTIDAIEMFKD